MAKIKNLDYISHIGVRALNEDKVLLNETQKVFGVFDGASSLNAYLSPDGKSGAYIAAKIAADTFASTDETLDKVALTANSNIEKAHTKMHINLSTSVNRFGTTAAVVKIFEDNTELLQIGDSIILFIYKDGHVEVPLGYHDHDIEIMRKWRRLADDGATNIRNIIEEDLIKLRESANMVYGMLNGDKRLKTFIRTTTLSLKGVATILLLTDGMFIPKANPDADENWRDYVRLYQQAGLEGIYATVRKKETSDPKLIKYPRYKLHDDASAIAIDF